MNNVYIDQDDLVIYLNECIKGFPKVKAFEPEKLLKRLYEYADDVYDLDGRSGGYICIKACIDIVKSFL